MVKEGLLPPGAEHEWSRMEYSYYLLNGNGLNEEVVLSAIRRAKRRFFLRPAYVARHLNDVARLAASKRSIFVQVATRTLFGGKAVETPSAPFRNAPAALAEADRR